MKTKILIAVSNYYIEIASHLVKGARDFLLENKVDPNSIQEIYLPGCFEIPYIINKFDEFDAYIALGCIIRGETYHFELISNEVTRKLMDLSVSLKKPIGFGILTCENLQQALKRSNPIKGNKGREAAAACFHLLKA